MIKKYNTRRIPLDQFSYVITDLEPGSVYKVRVSFLDDRGTPTGYVSKEVRTTAVVERTMTELTTTTVQPTNTTVPSASTTVPPATTELNRTIPLECELISAIPTSTTIEVKWKERFPGKSSLPPVFGSIIHFGEYTDGMVKLYMTKLIRPNQFSYVITDLQPDSLYKVRVSFFDDKQTQTGYVSKVVRTTAEAETTTLQPTTTTVPPTTTTELAITTTPSVPKLIGYISKWGNDLTISWKIEGVDLGTVAHVKLFIGRAANDPRALLNKEFPVDGSHKLKKVPRNFAIYVQIDVFLKEGGNILRARRGFQNYVRAESVTFESTEGPPTPPPADGQARCLARSSATPAHPFSSTTQLRKGTVPGTPYMSRSCQR
ncbi:endonuclease-reverse transcriptase [Plakobranchus ocellatus]|uniref:Endonuclease-reverse transcriptase n=1 Tax=Plakobranchus ocellatus TaxID=259542 RepID=A0AAV3Y1V4_9GAST|nr:endonuclease-reverse transcriptase [Plakobranchus ocellatus]